MDFNCELYCFIVNNGSGSKVIKIAKENGIDGVTALIGKGTISSKLLNALGISEERKELILMAAEQSIGDKALDIIHDKMHMDKPNKGISFSLPIMKTYGSRLERYKNIKEEELKMGYYLIITIVERGNDDQVIDAASSAGSRGGTVLNGRGSGIHETKKLFNIEIEPEKELVLILAKSDVTEQIVAAIRKELEIDEPGKGIIFILDVNKTYGLFEG